jgi:effector-associated domain 2 (EAD2)-containing protein
VTEITPATTRALVVGVEKYRAGPDWNLNGPALDAYRFVEWLRNRGVPADQISLFVSPLDANRASLLPKGVVPRPATQNEIQDTLLDGLRTCTLPLLFLYWGGHGVITLQGERKLFYADADAVNKKNLDLTGFQALLRTNYYSATALQQQIVIVDACANYVESRNWRFALAGGNFPYGSPVESREQVSLMAARPGEKSANLDAEQTGLFSRELRLRVANASVEAWPPDVESIAHDLVKAFAVLRNQGKAYQTSTFAAFKNWKTGQEVTVGTVSSPESAAQGFQKPKPAVVKAIADVLLECDCLADRASRDVTLKQVRRDVIRRTARMPQEDRDMFNLVDMLLNYSGALAELVRAARSWEGNSLAMEKVDALLLQLLPNVLEESKK